MMLLLPPLTRMMLTTEGRQKRSSPVMTLTQRTTTSWMAASNDANSVPCNNDINVISLLPAAQIHHHNGNCEYHKEDSTIGALKVILCTVWVQICHYDSQEWQWQGLQTRGCPECFAWKGSQKGEYGFLCEKWEAQVKDFHDWKL